MSGPSSSSSTTSMLVSAPTPTYPTDRNGCWICPSTAPECPACPSGQVCNLSLQSCHECPAVQCVPIGTQVFAYPSPTASSASPSSSTTTPSAESSTRSTGLVGPVIGGTAGGVIVLLIVALLIFWCCRRRRNQGNKLEIYSIEEDEKHTYPFSIPTDDTSSSPISREMEENGFSIMHKTNYSDKNALQKNRQKTRKNINNNGLLAISNPRILSSTYKEPTVALSKSASINNIHSLKELNQIEQQFQQHLQGTREKYIRHNTNAANNNTQSIRTSLSPDMYNNHIVRTSTYNRSPTTPAQQVIPNFLNYNFNVGTESIASPDSNSPHHYRHNVVSTNGGQPLSSHLRELSESSDFSVNNDNSNNNPANVIPIAYIPGVTSRPVPNSYRPIYSNHPHRHSHAKNGSNSQLLYPHYGHENDNSSFTSVSDTSSYINSYQNNARFHNVSSTTAAADNRVPMNINANNASNNNTTMIGGSRNNTNSSGSVNSNSPRNPNFQMTVDSSNFDNVNDSSDDEYGAIQSDMRAYR